jgi:hypothetical protein
MGEAFSGFWWERDQCGDPGMDGRIVLKQIFRKWDMGYGLDWEAGSG